MTFGLTAKKYIYSGKNKILIDDLTDNIKPCKERGDIGILFETPKKTIDILIKNKII